MEKKKVLIVGGYGTVGSVVSEILSKDEKILPVISGRDKSKARELAERLNTEWITIDLTDEESISSALVNIDIVINCFSGPFTNFHLFLPESASKQGIHYLDVAGSYEYAERFLTLNDLAVKNKSILITSLGANPGIPGIMFMNAKYDFDEVDSGKIYFIIGSSLEGISVSSLKELKYMFDVIPLVWSKSQWVAPPKKGWKEHIGKPFEKEIYGGISLTRDLLAIPKLVTTNHLSFCSGSQSTFQGLIMIMGFKIGLTKNDKFAQFLLNILKKIGRGKNSIADALIKVDITGKIDEVRQKKTFEMYCEENYATAIAPAIVCQQIAREKISKYGAFVPPEAVPAKDFVEHLRKFDINFSVTTEVT